ncbi:DUF5723 family protein [Algibacter pacificus]|uniref:DUF5723 family protein n=1 Tax=Algibacter pacificus TaxID=2599389 RepID=UPI0011CA752B|nr:DUF5723 family protein [Algibacter pacificus]
MINLKKLTLAMLCIAGYTNLQAQSYVGFDVDNYAGVHGLISNPSNVVDSRLKTDVNLFSASAFGGSDYFGISLSDAVNSDEGFDFDTSAEKYPTNANNFFLNVDILGPSFMFNLTPKNSIGFVSRVRAFMNINNINGELYETVADDFENTDAFDFDLQNLSGTIHAWAEVGLVYGRVLVDNEKSFLKGGVTLKYLQGAGSLFLSSPGLKGRYDSNVEKDLTTSGNLNYGTTQDFDNDDISLDNLGSGFGADIGFTYEFRGNDYTDQDFETLKDKNKYKLKIGASITDIGSISYDETTVSTYDLGTADAPKSVDTDNADNDTEQFLKDKYDATDKVIDQEIKLPTALHLLVDYHIKSKLYVSLQGNFSLIDSSKANANTIINAVTVAPRLETKWFSVYSPISMRKYDEFAWGAGLRLGPLMVGSGSVLSNLVSGSTAKSTDVFVGLKIPIYQ